MLGKVPIWSLSLHNSSIELPSSFPPILHPLLPPTPPMLLSAEQVLCRLCWGGRCWGVRQTSTQAMDQTLAGGQGGHQEGAQRLHEVRDGRSSLQWTHDHLSVCACALVHVCTHSVVCLACECLCVHVWVSVYVLFYVRAVFVSLCVHVYLYCVCVST